MTAYQGQPNRVRGIGLIVSVLLHGLVFGALIFLAAREGMLGRELRKMAVTLVPRPKQAEPLKTIEKTPTVPAPQVTAVQPPKLEPVVQQPPIFQERIKADVPALDPPSISSPRLAAPPPIAIPAVEFGGTKVVETASDPIVLYRGYVEFTFRSNWIRPANMQDQTFIAEIEVSIDQFGAILEADWKKGSGNRLWDASVRDAVAKTKTIGRRPPEGFPDQIMVRFDVQAQTEVWNQ